MALAEAVNDDQVRQLCDERSERGRRAVGAEVAEALVDDHLPDAALHAPDEVDQRRLGHESAVGVVRADDHDRVGLVALDHRLEHVEVQPEVLLRVELVRDDRPGGELVVGGERRQAQQQGAGCAGEQRVNDLARAVGDDELVRGRADGGRQHRGDRRAL